MKKKNKNNPSMKINLKKWKPLIVFILVTVICSISWSASEQYIEIKTISLQNIFNAPLNWHVTAYQAKDAETNFGTANLCFWHDPSKKDQFCFKAEDDHRDKEEHYSYYIVKDLKIVQLQKTREPKHGILFVAENHGFDAGGFLIFASIWSYNKKEEKFVKILPSIRITDQGELGVFQTIGDKIEGVFVGADYIWGKGEARYDYHNYEIKIYKFEEGAFRLVKKYKTKRKYNSDVEKIDVIKYELNNIQRYMTIK